MAHISNLFVFRRNHNPIDKIVVLCCCPHWVIHYIFSTIISKLRLSTTRTHTFIKLWKKNLHSKVRCWKKMLLTFTCRTFHFLFVKLLLLALLISHAKCGPETNIGEIFLDATIQADFGSSFYNDIKFFFPNFNPQGKNGFTKCWEWVSVVCLLQRVSILPSMPLHPSKIQQAIYWTLITCIFDLLSVKNS